MGLGFFVCFGVCLGLFVFFFNFIFGFFDYSLMLGEYSFSSVTTDASVGTLGLSCLYEREECLLLA